MSARPVPPPASQEGRAMKRLFPAPLLSLALGGALAASQRIR